MSGGRKDNSCRTRINEAGSRGYAKTLSYFILPVLYCLIGSSNKH